MPLQVLIVEGRPADAERLVQELRKAGFEPEWKRVDTETGIEANLNPDLDVVLSGYALPHMSVRRVLHLVEESETRVPVIVVSDAIGEEEAAECLKLGATDCIQKDQMARLGPVIHRAIKERLVRVAKLQAEASMNRGEGRIREELRRHDEQARQLQSLTELNEFKSHFINMVAHDLGNVVTPMRVNLHGLRKAVDEGKIPEHAKSVQLISRGLDRLLAFVADLLEAARLQSGKLRITLQPIDLVARVDDAVEQVRSDALARGIRLETRLSPTAVVHADPARIDQVLANLLSNALKFTPAGGEVTVALESHAGGGVTIRVADNGRGLAADDLPKLFQPFSQIGVVGQGKHTGTGLGLFICRGIVEGHGGKIWVESAGPGRGSTFFIHLPT